MNKMIYLIACIALTAISCGLQTTGAVSVPLLAPKPSASVMMNSTNTNTAMVNCELLNFRIAAGEENGTVTGYPYLTFGDVVTLTGNTKTTPDLAQWVEVEFQGVTGWVNNRYLEAK